MKDVDWLPKLVWLTILFFLVWGAISYARSECRDECARLGETPARCEFICRQSWQYIR